MNPRTFVIVGGGLAGAKAAQTLRDEGFDGRVVLFGDERERPYEPAAAVEGFRGDTTVSSVVTTDGEELPADVVVVGIGARPNLELVQDAGLAVEDGVLVDASLRTDDPDAYAAGDIAAVPSSATAGGCGSSTGRTPTRAGRPPRRRCSARTSATTNCRTSSPTSTTSAWSSPAGSRRAATTAS